MDCSIAPIKNCYIIIKVDGNYILRPSSLYQRLLLKNAIIYHMDFEGEAKLMDSDGKLFDCTPHQGTKNNCVEIIDSKGRILKFYTSTTDDMDILTLILRSSYRDLVDVRHSKFVHGAWHSREEGTFIRRSIATEIRKQEIDTNRIMQLLKVNRDYGKYLDSIMNMAPEQVLERLGLL